MTKQPGMTTHQSLPAATGNLINPTVTPTYPPVTPTCTAVIPDLIGALRADSLAPGVRISVATSGIVGGVQYQRLPVKPAWMGEYLCT